ncbi:hypothetical protein [Aureimonas sp. AU20]|uniref:hypothetical protein n=1 Tax=Aureimonas sp. AU20 TaxID=1349819 RepID=UPI000B2F503F|nr:hypothetical protein [Aureimonas sp. AU20]
MTADMVATPSRSDGAINLRRLMATHKAKFPKVETSPSAYGFHHAKGLASLVEEVIERDWHGPDPNFSATQTEKFKQLKSRQIFR